MKKMVSAGIVLLLALACVSTPAVAAIEVEGDAYVGIFDKYLWRGFDLSGSEMVGQGGIDLSAGNFTLSWWTNVQLKSNRDEGYIAGESLIENDIILDYSFDLGEMVSVSVGDIFYMVEEDWPDTHELYLSVGLNTILEPSFTVYYDWDECEENGLFYTVSVGHGFDINDKVSVAVGALASYNDENDFNIGDYSDWHNLELSASVDFAITDQISISPSFVYSEPLSDDAEDVIDDETVVGITATFTF